MKNTENATIGAIIREFRHNRGLTQSQLANGICSRDFIYALEYNKNEPSFFILNKLSNKLCVNLYEYYNTLQSYDSIQTFTLVSEMFEYISEYDYSSLAEFIKTNEEKPEFQSGESYKCLMYGKATLEHEYKNYNTSLSICLEIFKSEKITLDENEEHTKTFNHIEILILNLIAINYHSLGMIDKAFRIYTLLYNQLNLILSHRTFELNNHLCFETKEFLNVCSNLALLQLTTEHFDEAEQILNSALKIGQKTKFVHCHCELLFGLCTLYYYTDRIEKAKELLNDIEVFARYEHKEQMYSDFIEQAKVIHPELFI